MKTATMDVQKEIKRIQMKVMKNTSHYTENSKPVSQCKYGCDGSGVILIDNDRAAQCQCVIDNHNKKKSENLLKFANIPENFENLTVDSFLTDVYTEERDIKKATIAKKVVTNFYENFELYSEKGIGLYFYSETPGSGKSRMGMSLANDLIKNKNEQVKYTTVSDLFEEIKSTFNSNSKNTSSELIDAVKNTNVLILDELGVEKISDWVEEVFFSLMNNRINNNKVTIFTSNKKIKDLEYTERTKSRIERAAEFIYFPEEDLRNRFGDIEKDKLRKTLFQ